MTQPIPKTEVGRTICVVTEDAYADRVGFRLRRDGYDVRDSFFVVTPDATYIAFVLRTTLEDTVVRTVVRRGEGAVHIDASRIALDDYDLTEYIPNRVGYKDGIDHVQQSHEGYRRTNTYDIPHTGRVFNTDGRYPSNLLLVHGASCTMEGVREIKTRADTRPDEDAGRTSKEQWRYTPTSETKRGYGGDEGVEKVPEWDCQPDCPVHQLNQQSGNLGHSFRTSRDHQSGMMGWQAGNGEGYDDGGGGAGRFFFQGHTHEDITAYLATLVGAYDRVFWLTND